MWPFALSATAVAAKAVCCFTTNSPLTLLMDDIADPQWTAPRKVQMMAPAIMCASKGAGSVGI